jgi:hypothetical protein
MAFGEAFVSFGVASLPEKLSALVTLGTGARQ